MIRNDFIIHELFMKKIIAAVLALMIILCGCGQKTNVNDNESDVKSKIVSSTIVETPDTSSRMFDDTVTDIHTEESKKSTDSDSSKSSSGKSSSSKSSSSKSEKTSSKTTSSTQQQTHTYAIGDANDPIRDVAPENVQQFIIEEETIMTDPEPPSYFVNEYENVDPSEKVDDSWFDDCVFLGDSLTVGLSLYNDANRVFGNAEFVCATSLGYWNSQWDINRAGNVHPYYRGQKILLEDAVSVTGAKKAIITLGMNDIGIWGPDGVIDYARSLLYKIRAKSPDVKIYFQTVSPMIYSAQRTHLNNTLIRQFNANLERFAAQEGCGFLNSYAALSDSNGNLPYNFCSDPNGLGIHLKFNGCAVWAEFIKANIGSAHPEPEPKPEPELETESDTETDSKSDASSNVVSEADVSSEPITDEQIVSENETKIE